MQGPDPKARGDDPRVAIVTVSYGSGAVLDGFLSSIPMASTSPVLTVVADNAAESDGVADLAARHGAQYLALPQNLGYGGAVNAAARDLPDGVDWILVCNPDLVLGAGAVDALVATGDADPAVASVGPLIRDAAGAVYPSARKVPSLRTGVGHALFANLWLENPWTRAYRNDTDLPPRRRDAGWLSGACVLVRRSTFDRLGGFDPGYFMYFEDVDLGYRIGAAGLVNRYEPAAEVTHTGAHSTTTESESARMIEVHHRSARRFIDRKYRGWWLWPVRVVLAVGLTVRSALIRRRIRTD